MAYGLLIAMGVMALVFVAITRRVAAAIRTAVRMAMCDIFATRANWPSCEAGSTSVGLATGRVIEGETLHYLWFVSSDLMVRCYHTINPTFAFIEGDWGLTQSALAEEIGVYQASISSEDGAVELPQQFHSDINRLLLEEVNAA